MAEEKLPDLDDLLREVEERDGDAEPAESVVREAAKSSNEAKGDLFSLLEKFRSVAFREHLDVAMPCVVVEYNRPTRMAIVKPLVRDIPRDLNGSNRETKQIDREEIFCTVQQFAANGFVIDLPIKPGDVGWCIGADRDSSAVKIDHKTHDAVSTLNHRFEFGFFIPDYWGIVGHAEAEGNEDLYKSEDNRLVISTFDGSQRISVGREDIKVFATNATITAKEECTIIAEKNANINTGEAVYIDTKNVYVTGEVSVTGGITATGEITANSGSTNNTVGKHTHTSTTPGEPTSTPTANT